jgi:integrase
MSVRKRRWFTTKQVQRWAARLAFAAGESEDAWPKHLDRARRESADFLRRLGDDDPAAIKALAKLGAKDAPKEAWLVDYADHSGTRNARTFAKKKDADAYHATVRVEVDKGTHVAPNKSLTVAEAGEKWIRRVEADGRERTTIRQYRQHLNLHIILRLGATKVAHLAKPRVETFRDELLASLSRALARKVMTSLKSLLKEVGMAHLAAGVSIKRDKRKRKLEVGKDIPDPKEVGRLIGATSELRHRALLLTVALTGLRASEVRGLRWKDVDVRAGEIRIRQRADRYNEIGPPKSESSVRDLPVPPEALAALKEWKVKCPPNEQDLVFPTSTGRVEHHSNMLRSLEPVMVAAGIVTPKGEGKYALHAFRHFFASWCINPRSRGGRELPPKEVQTLLGHSSIVMTLDIYGHLFPRGDDRAELAAASRTLFA